MTTVFLLANCEGKGVTHHRFGFFFRSLLDHSSSSLSAKQANQQTTNRNEKQQKTLCLLISLTNGCYKGLAL